MKIVENEKKKQRTTHACGIVCRKRQLLKTSVYEIVSQIVYKSRQQMNWSNIEAQRMSVLKDTCCNIIMRSVEASEAQQ